MTEAKSFINSLLKGLLLFSVICGSCRAVNIIRPFQTPTPNSSKNNVDFDLIGTVKPVWYYKLASEIPVYFHLFTRRSQWLNLHLERTEIEEPFHIHTSLGQEATIRTGVYPFPIKSFFAADNTFDPTKRTIVIIPGYRSLEYEDWQHTIKHRWLILEDVNVIIVQWKAGNQGLYETAVSNTKVVARQITLYLNYLMQSKGGDFESREFRENIYLIGHSLGAHIAAFVGQEMPLIGRITGLDPAGPDFDMNNMQDRLDTSDALFVDIIHTNGGKLSYLKTAVCAIKSISKGMLDKVIEPAVNEIFRCEDQGAATSWFGLDAPIGHVDYYANGGRVQPGCYDDMHICDHNRAHELYASYLDYEIHARNAYGWNSDVIQLKKHRLVAFQANDYEEFKTGASLIKKCERLIKSRPQKRTDEEEFMIHYGCSIPIDFITKPAEFKFELQQNDKLHPGTRHFMKTQSTEPYVSEHYVLRVSIPNYEKWSTGCRFMATVRQNDDDRRLALVDYNRTTFNLYSDNTFNGLILPFVNPIDWRKSFPTSDKISLLIETGSETEGEARTEGEQVSGDEEPEVNEEEIEQKIQQYLPSFVNAYITQDDTKGWLGESWSFAKHLFSKDNQISSRCKIQVKNIEVRPLIAKAYKYSFYYMKKEELHHSTNITMNFELKVCF